MRTKSLTCVAVLTAALAAGCGDDKPPPPPAGGGRAAPGDLQMDPNSTATKKAGGAMKPEAPKQSNQQ